MTKPVISLPSDCQEYEAQGGMETCIDLTPLPQAVSYQKDPQGYNLPGDLGMMAVVFLPMFLLLFRRK